MNKIRSSSMLGSRLPVPGAGLADMVKRARSCFDSGLREDAWRLCQAILRNHATQFDALHILGLLYFQSGDAAQAEPFIRRSLAVDANQAWAFANHGKILMNLGQHDFALKQFERALGLDRRHIPALVGQANALQELGELEQSLLAYERALEMSSDSAEAWSNRGKLLLTLNRPEDALKSLNRSLQLDVRAFATHTNRFNALRALNRHAEALESYANAVAIEPRTAEIWCLHGMSLQDMGRDADSLISYDAALAIRPNYIEVLSNKGVALERLQHYDAALICYDRMLALEPNEAQGWLGRGNALQGLLCYEDSVAAYGEALRIEPNYSDALSNLGAALRHLRRFAEALETYDRVLVQIGERADVLGARGNVLQRMGRFEEASASYIAAVAVAPCDAPGWFHRATSLQHLNRHVEALPCYERVLAIQPTHGAARAAEACCRLILGDLEGGWTNHEARWEDPAVTRHKRAFPQPLWLGDRLIAGRTILLHAEQGLGDTLQFCRYASLLEGLGATVILEVPRVLRSLMSTLKGISALVSPGEMLPSFDLHCPLMSLPLACRNIQLSEPKSSPYLHADEKLTRMWGERLDEILKPGRLRVGLAWSGNPEHANDHNRSIALEALFKWFELDVNFISLQDRIRVDDELVLKDSGITHFGPALRDFSDTAALVNAIDLIVAVDTSVAHLAGALGRPLWLMLPYVPDWRWMLDREDTSWYPGVRLFRQPAAGDWSHVVARITEELRARRGTNELRPSEQMSDVSICR